MKWNFLSSGSPVVTSPVCIRQSEDALHVAYRSKGELKTYSIQEPLENQLVAFQTFVQKNGLKHQSCHYVLSDNKYRLMLLDAPKVPEEEMKLALPWLVKDLIDLPIDQVGLDVFPLPFRQDNVDKVYVVISELSKLQETKQFIQSSGLVLDKINILELAMLPILKKLAGENIGLVYLQNSDIHIMISGGGALYFTRRIGSVSQLDSRVEKDQLLLELQRSIDFCQVQLRQPALEQLYFEVGLKARIAQDEELSVPTSDLPMDQLLVSGESGADQEFQSGAIVAIGELLAYEARD